MVWFAVPNVRLVPLGPIPSVGDMTAEALAKAGKADLVNHYLDRIAEGGTRAKGSH